MTRPQQFGILALAVAASAWAIARATAAPMPQDQGYTDLGTRSNRRMRLGTRLSPDPQPPAVYPHFVAHPGELDQVHTGPHPLYGAHPASMSPNCTRVQTSGWEWTMNPPSEVVI